MSVVAVSGPAAASNSVTRGQRSGPPFPEPEMLCWYCYTWLAQPAPTAACPGCGSVFSVG